MFLILFLPWLLLILPVWIDSGLWENYPKGFRYPTRYIHGNSYLHQVRQSSTTRSMFSAPEHHLYSTSSSTLRTRESKITVPYFSRSSYNSAINLIHASKSFSTCISHTNMVNSNPMRTHLTIPYGHASGFWTIPHLAYHRCTRRMPRYAQDTWCPILASKGFGRC